MIIDGHSHITLPVEEHIKAMDAAGIDKTVLFSTTFHPEAAKDFTEVQSSMEFLHEMLAGKKALWWRCGKRPYRSLWVH